MPRDPSSFILHRSTNFFIQCCKPVALTSVTLCDNLKYPNFRLIVPSHFKLIASFLIRLMDNFKYFLFSDIFDIHAFSDLSRFLSPMSVAGLLGGRGG